MSRNKNLNEAAIRRYDEWYTRIGDVENELKNYKEYFKGKVVYCNCDDPRESAFFHYFSYNYDKIGLNKLITTCYKNKSRDLFSNHDTDAAIYLEYSGEKNGGNIPTPEQIGIKELKGDGDFRSIECINLLKKADIVVTNPPFSLFREYVAQLIKYEKKFLILGNINAIPYKEVFPLIQSNMLWLGVTNFNKGMYFKVPDDFVYASSYRFARIMNGENVNRVSGVCWYTNIETPKRHEEIILYKEYSEDEYLKYDNYDAIEVSKVKDIPKNYFGIMGVPITFLDKHNPDQFEILGITDRQNTSGLRTKVYTQEDSSLYNDLNARSVIRIGNEYKAIYARILIRRK